MEYFWEKLYWSSLESTGNALGPCWGFCKATVYSNRATHNLSGIRFFDLFYDSKQKQNMTTILFENFSFAFIYNGALLSNWFVVVVRSNITFVGILSKVL